MFSDGQPCMYVPKDGNYEHPSSCRKYIYCKNKQAMEVPCSGDLWFNVKKGTCDIPRNVDCPRKCYFLFIKFEKFEKSEKNSKLI